MPFDHPDFDKYDFENIPLDQDIYLVDQIWAEEYEQMMLKVFERGSYEPVGYVGYAAVRSLSASGAELSWYPNINDRFHEVRITLPRDQFVSCVGSWRYDEKPRVFVQSAWLDNIYLRSNSVFALIDAIGMREAIKNDRLSRDMLIQLRDRIDVIAAKYPDVSFISFADSLLLKSNWHAGQFDRKIKYDYKPEIFIQLISEIQSAYREVLGVGIYAVLTQGSNAYYDDPQLHVSRAGNHISLNSLGLPFSQLMSIERAAKTAIKDKTHRPAELYMDKTFFNSLRFAAKFEKSTCSKNSYREPLLGDRGLYYFSDGAFLLSNLEQPKF